MTKANNIVEILLSEKIGIFFVCNMLDSVTAGLFCEKDLSELCNRLLEKFDASGCPIKTAADVVHAFRAIAASGEKNYKNYARLASRNYGLNSYAHAVKAETLLTLLRPPNDPGLYITSTLHLDDQDLYIDILTELSKEISKTGNVFFEDATIGYEKLGIINPAWLTDAKVLNEEIERGGSGDDLRDILGLSHLNKTDYLVLLKFNIELDKTCKDIHIARPSFIDGGNSRFRVIPDTHSGQWGKTVHLGRLRRAERIIDGIVECVTLPIKINSLKEAELVPIGEVTQRRGELNEDCDETFQLRLLKNKNIADLKDFLLRIFTGAQSESSADRNNQ